MRPVTQATIAQRDSTRHLGAELLRIESGGKDFVENIAPNSLKVMTDYVEPSLTSGGAIEAKADDKFQFERHRYFVADRVDHAIGKPVFNLAVGLKDSWGK